MLTLEKIYHAKEVVDNVIRNTQLIPTTMRRDCKVYVKPENLQVTGSFKIRGAYYKMMQLTAEEKRKGVIACSAGNHAQGVALAGKKAGVKTLICLPAGAPIAKVEATKNYGAEVCMVEGVYDDAYNKAIELQKKHGYTFVHPFNDVDVIAGQGTIGLELVNQLPEVDVVIVPIGGGGLISGVAYALKQLKPSVKVYGVQSQGAPSMYNSIAHNQIEKLPSVSTIADGIAVKQPGDLTFSLCQKYVDGIVTVTDTEVASAIMYLAERYKLVAEGAGAVSVAAMMHGKIEVESGKNVICVVSGGNIDINILSRVINSGLRSFGRTCKIKLELLDTPGELSKVTKICADLGANILSVHHERAGESNRVNACHLKLLLETRNFAHVEEIEKAFTDMGYKLI